MKFALLISHTMQLKITIFKFEIAQKLFARDQKKMSKKKHKVKFFKGA